MPYKNDNLDELFQNAARDYPLKTDNSDWDNLAAKLKTPVAQKVYSVSRLWKYAAIILLLAGGSVILYERRFNHVNPEKQDEIVKQVTPKGIHKNLNTVASGQSSKTNKSSALKNKTYDRRNNYANAFIHEAPVIAKEKNHLTYDQNAIEIDPQLINTETLNTHILSNDITETTQINTGTTNLQPVNKVSEIIMDRNKIKTVADKVPATSKTIRLQPSYRIYGILFGGPELSSVKFQQVVKPGYKIGVALGYKINKKFSVELGLQRENVNFFSNGKYMDTSLLRIKSNAAIENAHAHSKITSVPLFLRYNFSSKTPGHFFAAAGVNAIVITHNEKYEYAISKNGVEGNISKKYSSLKSPKYFTGLNVSAGYETRFTNWCNIKIEPYYQLPISDFGVGRLPVSSFGINVGIVKDLK